MKNAKKVISVILSLVMIMSMFAGLEISSFAEDDVLSYLTYEINNGEVTITGIKDSAGKDIVIPDAIEGYPVTIIGSRAFAYNEGITSVEIPDSVTTIGNAAFYACSGLTSIDIPDSVTTINNTAFALCVGLTSIEIPDSVTTLSNSAFRSCDNIESISVSENNEYYSSDEYGVLFNKDKTELIQYPIGNDRTEYSIPGSVTTIGDCAFYRCGSLVNIEIPENVTAIGDSAFYGCESLVSIEIPDGVTAIGNSTFYDCKSLASIEIPDSVTTIGIVAFAYCDSLESVEIPASVTTIGDLAFGYVLDNNGNEGLADGFTISGYAGSAAEAYANENGIEFIALSVEDPTEPEEPEEQEILRYVIENGEVTITGCYGFVSGEVVVPDTIEGYPVTRIGDDAFTECFRMTSLVLPDSIIYIGSECFFGCGNLISFTIPDGVTEILGGTFWNCANLETIVIHENVTSIGSGAFQNCPKLKTVTIPESVTSIGGMAFGYVHPSSDIVLADDFTIIGTPGTAAEAYANENGIEFIVLGTEDPTDKPAESDKLVTDDENIVIDDDKKLSAFEPGRTAKDLTESISNSNFVIKDKDGNAVAEDALVGTGSKIQILDNNGNVVSEYDVVVPADVDGNGEITASDARKALRGSAGMDEIDGVYKLAADSDGNDELTASDARKILRKSAGLE